MALCHFSLAVPHGDPDVTDELVMMSVVEEDLRFLHAPDIQLLHDQTVLRILEWQPDILLAGGPPLYLSRLTKEQIDRAWQNALMLARGIDLFILDHHLLRCTEGITWLEELSALSGKPVLCAADFMCRKRILMEAERESLYRNFPVREGWHEDYAKGEATTQNLSVNKGNFLISSGLLNGDIEPDLALTELFSDTDEILRSRIPDLLKKMNALAHFNIINAFHIRQACARAKMNQSIDTLIALLKAGGVISPKLRALSDVVKAGSPVYEINPCVLA